MKVFITALMAVACSASPLWLQPTIYNHGLPVVTSPMVQPIASSYYQPIVKPVSYIQEDKVNVEKMDEEKVKVYKTEETKPVVYGFPGYGINPFYTAIKPVEYKAEVPSFYHSKSAGGVEHQVNKREADPVWPLTYTQGIHPTVGYTGYTGLPVTGYTGLPVTSYTGYTGLPVTGYTGLPVTSYMAKPVVQTVPKVTYKKPEVESNAKTIANDAINHFGYANKGQYVADSEGALHIAKREAEPFHHFTASPYTMYNPYMTQYVKPATVYSHPAYTATPFFGYQPLKVKSYSNDAVKPEDYASKGQYVAETEGSIHIAKREADPLVYQHPLSLSTYAVGSRYQVPYTTTYGFPYSTTYARPYYYL